MQLTSTEVIQKPKARAKEWRLVLIDDHPVVRHGVRDALANEQGLRIVDEAADPEEAMARVREAAPDLAIVDVSLGRRNGLDLIKQLRGEHPSMRILVLSVHDEELYAERALRAGADGYMNKAEPADRLVESIRTILSGGTALSPAMTERLVHQAVRTTNGEPTGVQSLSDRELEVFHLIGSGESTRKIAKRLCISIKTVETHRENIKRKLGVDNAAELTRYAIAWVENPS